MKTPIKLSLLALLLANSIPDMQAQDPTQLQKFAEFLEETAPADSTQTVSATAATESRIYYVVISQEGQSGIADLYIQSSDGTTRKMGNDEDIDKLILGSMPSPQAESLIFQLAEKEVKEQGKATLQDGMQNLVNAFGPKALNYISKERIQAYQKLGIVIPTAKK